MTINFRYRIYKTFITLKKRINNGSRLSSSFLKLMTLLKNFGIKAYVFYVGKIKYSISTRIFDRDGKNLKNISEASPADIVYLSELSRTNRKNDYQVKGGDWDKLIRRFEDSEFFSNVSEALRGNIPIEATLQYVNIEKAFSNHQYVSVENQTLTFNEWWQELQRLYQDHQSNQNTLSNEVLPVLSGVIVDIGRNGDLLLADGYLYLALAKLFELETIPITIDTRHVKWLIFRKRFHELVITVLSQAYQPPLHPDLLYIPAEQSSVERYQIIKQNMEAKSGLLLDLGANAGYFSIKFEYDGFDCTAVEIFPNFIFCLLGQKRALNKHLTVVEDSFLDRPDLLEQEYDVVLALNVFSHLIVHKETFEKLDDFLGKLKCKELFFEPYSPNDPQMKNSFVNFTEDEFAEYVRLKLGKANVKIIGKASDGRWIYKIS